MVEVYYYLPAGEVDNIIECGLKLSKWFDKEVVVEGEKKRCLSALLNPKDDIIKYESPDLKCVKLEALPKYCFAADKYLYQVGLNFPGILDVYMNTVIPVEKYIFGMYRLPECLVTGTVVAGNITLLDKRLDSPVLYDNSEELYINNIIETFKVMNDNFSDAMLYYFYCELAEMKKVDKIEDKENRIAVFFDKENRKTYTIKIPDISKY